VSYNDAVQSFGGTPVGRMTQEEAAPVVLEMMRVFLQVPEGEGFTFDEHDFSQAIQAMPIEEYVLKRQAIAAFHLAQPE
jgi:hypothetical protein